MKYFIILLLSIITASTQAEPIFTFRTVHGRVMDDKNKPLSNYSILVYGTSTNIYPNNAGSFKFNFPNERAIIISINNFKDPVYLFKVAPQDTFLNIKLDKATAALSARILAEWKQNEQYNIDHAMEVYRSRSYYRSADREATGSFFAIRIDEPLVTSPNQPNDPDLIYTAVEVSAEYKDGATNWPKYVSANLKYPAFAKANNIEGKVYLTFVVEKDGSLTDIKVIRGINVECDQEAIRLVKASGKWKPGMMLDKKPVRSQQTTPVLFKL